MSKNITFNEQSAKAGAYIRFPEFLLYDLHYSQMTDKAKVLYCHLLKKLEYSIFKTEEHERGEEGSKSYRDSEGDLYIIADNVELADVLKCSEPTLIKYKKELTAYDLLFETRVKGKSNRLYLLQPVDIGDKKAYYDNLNKLRAEQKEADRIKNEKEKKNKEQQKKAAARGKKAPQKTNKKQSKKAPQKNKKTTKKTAGTLAPIGNLKLLSYGNLKNLSYGNLKLLREYNYKSFKYYFKKNKSNLNLSISKYAFDPKTEQILLNNEDRLTDYILKKISELYKVYKYDLNRFHRILGAALVDAKYIVAYMKTSLKNPDKETAAAAPGKATKTEIVPEWLKEKQPDQEAADSQDESFQKQVAELQANLKRKYNQKQA